MSSNGGHCRRGKCVARDVLCEQRGFPGNCSKNGHIRAYAHEPMTRGTPSDSLDSLKVDGAHKVVDQDGVDDSIQRGAPESLDIEL